jgi:signal peptidase
MVRGIQGMVGVVLLMIAGVMIADRFSIFGQGKLFTVQSGSMEPALHTGSLIYVRSQTLYEIGDIVTRKTEAKEITVTHRIVERKTQSNGVAMIRTKGDANNDIDGGSFPSSNIIGKVQWSVPVIGFAVNFSRTSHGFIFLIIIPVTLLISEEFRKVKKEFQKSWREYCIKKSLKKDVHTFLFERKKL